MLTVSEAIRQRRSIRSFRRDTVPDDMVHEILEAARLAPSASNRQPWCFIVVTDGKEKARLGKICLDQAFNVHFSPRQVPYFISIGAGEQIRTADVLLGKQAF